MIKFALRCGHGHGFDAWFRDGATYAAQQRAGEIPCPICGDTRIEKAPMAPRISRMGRSDMVDGPTIDRAQNGHHGTGEQGIRRNQGDLVPASSSTDVPAERPISAETPITAQALRLYLDGVRRYVEAHCEPVGDRFAEEARAIHLGDVEPRNIYGTATEDEARELTDDGISFGIVPILPSVN